MGFRAQVRAAAVSLLTDYAASRVPPVKLQVYPGRPRSIHAPCAFVDTIAERVAYRGPVLMSRAPAAEIVLVHGLYDSKEAVDAADEFVDGFLDWVAARHDAADANTIVGIGAVVDDPTFVNDWVRPEEQRTWFATRITLEGFALD